MCCLTLEIDFYLEAPFLHTRWFSPLVCLVLLVKVLPSFVTIICFLEGRREDLKELSTGGLLAFSFSRGNSADFSLFFFFADKAATNWLRRMSNGKQCSTEKTTQNLVNTIISNSKLNLTTPRENQDMSTVEQKLKQIQPHTLLSNVTDGDKG